ncbi:hypothetical protein VTP01DRAFT_2678 [Rhizomucor pusillus]|uniref:uncharacterized protein n=1 Tax=Rhizomucor pusillus TaxID=4840 RepID=UPI0037422E89
MKMDQRSLCFANRPTRGGNSKFLQESDTVSQDDNSEENASACETEPGEIFMFQILKRSHEDTHQTPTSVKRPVTEYKRALKILSIEAGLFIVDISISAVVLTNLVEYVLLGETSWIFVTHIDTYIQNDKELDDCALPKTSKYDEQPTAVLVEKNEFRNSWREIVVQWGNLEFLVQAGFCRERGNNNRKAFLGSALSSVVSRILLDTEYDVIIRLLPPEVISSVRFLRNYCKSAASKTWSFESKRFAAQGFRACHPLAVDRSQARKTLRYKDKANLASYILQLVIEKTYTCQSRQKCLSILAKSLDLSHLKAEQWTNITTMDDALKMLPKKSTFIQPLNLINRIDKQLSNGTGRYEFLYNGTRFL